MSCVVEKSQLDFVACNGCAKCLDGLRKLVARCVSAKVNLKAFGAQHPREGGRMVNGVDWRRLRISVVANHQRDPRGVIRCEHRWTGACNHPRRCKQL